MITLYCYDVVCEVDGAQVVWGKKPPTECPIDASHEVEVGDGNFHQAHSVLTINDGEGRVFAITVNPHGHLNATQIYGDLIEQSPAEPVPSETVEPVHAP